MAGKGSTTSMRKALKQVVSSRNVLHRARARLQTQTDALPPPWYSSVLLHPPPIQPRREDPKEKRYNTKDCVAVRGGSNRIVFETDKLVNRYLRRNPDGYDKAVDLNASVHELTTYHPAFNFAERQNKMMKEEGMSMEESEQILDDLIKKENEAERSARVTNAQSISKSSSPTSSIPSLAVSEVGAWASRLSTVPYSDWSLGARQSLDHFVGTKVLEWSESHWGDVQFGIAPDAQECASQIKQVRAKLFPETLGDDIPEDEDDALSGDRDEMNSLVGQLEEWVDKVASDGEYSEWSEFERSEFDEFCIKIFESDEGEKVPEAGPQREEFLEHCRGVLLEESEEEAAFDSMDYTEVTKEFVDRGLSISVDELLEGEDDTLETEESPQEQLDRKYLNRGIMAERGEAMEGFRHMFERGEMDLRQADITDRNSDETDN